MRYMQSRALWGVILVVAGVLFLLQNLRILPVAGYVWAGLFALAGAVFIGVFLSDRESWWSIIPGLTLLGLSAVILLSLLFPAQAGAWFGGAFLFMIGLAFWIVFIKQRDYWWAIIPAGVLTTLAVVAAGTALWHGIELGGLFFIGLGLTFLAVALVHTPEGQQKWAYIPAGILLLMGVLIAAAAMSLANFVLPVALLMLGGYLVWRAVVYRHA